MPRWIRWTRAAGRYAFSEGRSESNTGTIMAGAPTEGATTAVDVPPAGAQRAADVAAAAADRRALAWVCTADTRWDAARLGTTSVGRW